MEDYFYSCKIKLEDNKKSYLKLLDMYFRPEEFFESIEKGLFEKIFPKHPDYIPSHKQIEKTRDFLAWNGWVFRGHCNSTWKLQTKFECLCFNKNFGRDLFELENGKIREFRRRIQKYDPQLASVDERDIYMLLSNMQHYGCATRFLDVSFSFFVALFFACGYLELSAPDEKPVADKKPNETPKFSIYCINRMWLEKTYKQKLADELKKFYEHDEFGKSVETQEAVWNYIKNYKLNNPNSDCKNIFKSVINMTPFYINPRLDRQKGSFLMPTNPYVPFEENLKSLIKPNSDEKYRILKIDVEYDNATLIYIQKFLDEMNINHAVLFNDVEGICNQINFKTRLPNDALTLPKEKK